LQPTLQTDIISKSSLHINLTAKKTTNDAAETSVQIPDLKG